MPTTSRGFPYPASTDAADGPAAFQALAAQMETVLDNNLTLGGQYIRFGLGGVLRSISQTTAQLRSNYNGTTDRLLDTSKPSWAIVAAGDVGNDRFAVYRAAPTAGSPSYTLLAYVEDDGTLTLAGDLTVGDINGRSSLASPYFRAYRSTAASYATGATVLFDSETDLNGWYDPTTGIFLPTVAGMYRVSWFVSLATLLTTGNKLQVSAVTGASALAASGSVALQSGTGGLLTSSGSSLLAFNGTTDSIHIVLTHSNGGSVAIGSGTAESRFEAEYVGV